MDNYIKPIIEVTEIDSEFHILAGVDSQNQGGVGGDLPGGEDWD